MTDLTLSELLEVVGSASDSMRGLSKSLVVAGKIKGYVEPKFRVETGGELTSSPILLVSARAAVGKSSLAHELSRRTGNPLVDLSGRRIADGYFSGRLPKDLADGEVDRQFSVAQSLRQALIQGQGTLIIDSADEALVSNGAQDFEAALLDLAGLIKNASGERPAAILLGRPDTIDVAHYFFLGQEIPVARVDVKFFDELSSRAFIKQKADEGKPTIPEFDQFLDEFFKRVLGALGASEWEQAESFVGYAPVLDALAAYYNPDGNFMKVFSDLNVEKSTRHVWVLLAGIIDAILKRETDKFATNFGAGNPAKIEFARKIYTTELQIELLLAEHPLELPIAPGSEPADREWLADVEGKVRGWFRDHPFATNPDRGRNPLRRFTNPAFRDYAVAKALGGAYKVTASAIKMYFTDPEVPPSPILARLALSGGMGVEKLSGAALALIVASHSTDLSDDAYLHVWAEARLQRATTRAGRSELQVQLFEPVGLAGQLICILEPDESIRLLSGVKRTTIEAPNLVVVLGEGAQDFALGPGADITSAEFNSEALDVRVQADEGQPNTVRTKRVTGLTKFVTPQDRNFLEIHVQSAAYPWTAFVTKAPRIEEGDDRRDIVRASMEFMRIGKWYIKRSMIKGPPNYPTEVMDALLSHGRGSVLAHDFGIVNEAIVKVGRLYELRIEGFSVKELASPDLDNEAYVSFLKSFLRWMKRNGRQFDRDRGLDRD